jgi:hypothetical protein
MITKKNINGNPEFGCELTLTLPYAYHLHLKNELGTVRTVKGMKPFYFFTDQIEEYYNDRSVDNKVALKDVPNNWIHHNALAITGKDYSELTDEEKRNVNGVLDYREWTPPPIREHYLKNNEINIKEKFVVICNRFNLEHGHFPYGYFDIPLLQDIFEYFNKINYKVIYKRPENNEFPVDCNETSDIINKYGIKAEDANGNVVDDKQISRMYDNVIVFDDLHKEYSHLSYNVFQLQLFSKSSGFISMGGGNTLLSCYFKQPVVSYFTTTKEMRDNYFGKNSYYRKLSNCDFYPIKDPEKNIQERGYRDYTELLETIKTVFK